MRIFFKTGLFLLPVLSLKGQGLPYSLRIVSFSSKDDSVKGSEFLIQLPRN